MAKHQRDAAKEAYWRGVLIRQAASGQSVREFCQQERLTESQFYAWRRTIGQRDAPGKPGPAFVSALVVDASPRESSIAIELAGGCVLKFSGPLASEQLADLIVALQSRRQR
jgi:hypothetical protein